MNSLHTFVVLAYKESEYLETCIKSVINQKYKSRVVIATSTPNNYIKKLANKYKLEIMINTGGKGIGADFDFALSCAKTELVTIAHQDDYYDNNYSDEMVKAYKKNVNRKPLIIFPDYYEIRNGQKVSRNLNLIIKRILLFPIRYQKFGKYKFFKRIVLRFGNSISCPSVCFVTKEIKFPVFSSKYKCNVDWNAWEKISKYDGSFIFVNKKLMGHRVHEASTTTEIINDNNRSSEDLKIYSRFWPEFIAKIFTKIYKNSEKSNKVKE